MILIQGAMDVEVEYLIDNLKQIENKIVDGYEFFIGKLNGEDIVVSKTNIGIINASVSTILGIKEFKPNIIINQGTVGRIWKNNT